MNDMIKNSLLWFIIVVVLISVFSNFGSPRFNQVINLSYSQFMDKVENGDVKEVTVLDEQSLYGVTQNNEAFTTYAPAKPDFYWVDELSKNNRDC